MARLLNATGYVSSVLATVCLVLALVAAPIGEARADGPGGGDTAFLCGGRDNPGGCNLIPEMDCDGPNCSERPELCKWASMPPGGLTAGCGCFSK